MGYKTDKGKKKSYGRGSTTPSIGFGEHVRKGTKQLREGRDFFKRRLGSKEKTQTPGGRGLKWTPGKAKLNTKTRNGLPLKKDDRMQRKNGRGKGVPKA